MLLVSDGSRAGPSGADQGAAIAVKLLDRSHIPLYNPVVDVSNAQILRVVNITDERLPGIIDIRLSRPRLFRVHLFDRKPVLARNSDVMGVAVGAHPPKTGGMMGERKLQTVDVGGHHDVIPVGVLVNLDAGVIAGHDYIAQDREGPVVAGRRADAGLAVGGFGRLHIVAIGIDEDVLEFALHRVQQIDPADAGIVVGADVQVPQAHFDSRELHV